MRKEISLDKIEAYIKESELLLASEALSNPEFRCNRPTAFETANEVLLLLDHAHHDGIVNAQLYQTSALGRFGLEQKISKEFERSNLIPLPLANYFNDTVRHVRNMAIAIKQEATGEEIRHQKALSNPYGQQIWLPAQAYN